MTPQPTKPTNGTKPAGSGAPGSTAKPLTGRNLVTIGAMEKSIASIDPATLSAVEKAALSALAQILASLLGLNIGPSS